MVDKNVKIVKDEISCQYQNNLSSLLYQTPRVCADTQRSTITWLIVSFVGRSVVLRNTDCFFCLLCESSKWKRKKKGAVKTTPSYILHSKKSLCAGKHCTYLPPFFLGRRTAWMLGNTPPAAMVVLEKSLFNSSSLRTANWM